MRKFPDQVSSARWLRPLLVAGWAALVFVLVIGGLGRLLAAPWVSIALPFVAAALCVLGLELALAKADRLGLAKDVAGGTATSPYAALAEAARIRGDSLDEALPELARVIAEGTGAARGELWLAMGDTLVRAATFPPSAEPARTHENTHENLATLLAEPDTDYVVPVLAGSAPRAALVIRKPGKPVRPEDQRLLRDVASGAGLLLRGIALNAELRERVRRADELATELTASRRRLTHARDVERRRLVSELGSATTERLARLREQLRRTGAALTASAESSGMTESSGVTENFGPASAPDEAPRAIQRARAELDELLDRFRVIARGVYPAVLRDQGPMGALDELATDLPRTVHLSGALPQRLTWEIESGIYYLAASALRTLGERPSDAPLRVSLAHTGGRLSVRIEDPCADRADGGVAELRAALADDADRLAALGGALELSAPATGSVEHQTSDQEQPTVLYAWLPDQLEPTVNLSNAAEAGALAGVTRS